MSTALRVYLAASFAKARWVESVVAPLLTARGCDVVSTWHRAPHIEAEALKDMPAELRHEIAATNDRDIAQADVVVVVASVEARETWAELVSAWRAGVRCIVIEPMDGTMPLSAYRPGVMHVVSVGDAVDVAAGLRRPSWMPMAMAGSSER